MKLMLVVCVKIGGVLLIVLMLIVLVFSFLSSCGLVGNLSYCMVMFWFVRCFLSVLCVLSMMKLLYFWKLMCSCVLLVLVCVGMVVSGLSVSLVSLVVVLCSYWWWCGFVGFVLRFVCGVLFIGMFCVWVYGLCVGVVWLV